MTVETRQIYELLMLYLNYRAPTLLYRVNFIRTLLLRYLSWPSKTTSKIIATSTKFQRDFLSVEYTEVESAKFCDDVMVYGVVSAIGWLVVELTESGRIRRKARLIIILATLTDESEIPLLAVTMSHAETSVFTVVALDRAGNVAVGSPSPLTVDTTPPQITGFRYMVIYLHQNSFRFIKTCFCNQMHSFRITLGFGNSL